MKKLASLRKVSKVLSETSKDGVAFFGNRLTDEIQNLPESATPGFSQGKSYIRRITGFLNKSILVVPNSDFSATLTYNAAIAPYVFRVFDYALERYGMTPIGLVLMHYKSVVMKLATEEVKKAVQTISAGESYKYQNPYPA